MCPTDPAPVTPTLFGRGAAWTLVVLLTLVSVPTVVPMLALVPAWIRQSWRSRAVPPLPRRPSDIAWGVLAGLALAAVGVVVACVTFFAACSAGMAVMGGPRQYGIPPDGAFFLGAGVGLPFGGGRTYLFCWLLDRGGA
jgi:hypothetical protein